MKRIYEFRCFEGHVTERYADERLLAIKCDTCSKEANRILSAPRIKLEGITGAFPSAADRWANTHEEATRLARKRKQEATA
jgi:hypothetical protein